MLLTGAVPLQFVPAQVQASDIGHGCREHMDFIGHGCIWYMGGVDKDGTWYVGEGLKIGDYFAYNMCHVDYKECTDFVMNIWIAGEIITETKEVWLAEVVVYDKSNTIVGNMELGKLAPEPIGGSEELGPYRSAFKSSVVWLSTFTSQIEPKAFQDTSWTIIGLQVDQVRPISIETITVPAGTWEETVKVFWKRGGTPNEVWIVDEFPFPIKASVVTRILEGVPPQEYKFELLKYEENILENPFEGISSVDHQALKGCPQIPGKESVKKSTANHMYQIHVEYGPEYPVQGCEMNWVIQFINKDDTRLLNHVQYDLLVVDDDGVPLRSIAQEEGTQFLHSRTGQATVDIVVNEEPGTAHYVIWVYGLAPKFIVPTGSDFIQIDVPITALKSVETSVSSMVPSWFKNNAEWWADGVISDENFVNGIQFLIKEGILRVPATEQNKTLGSDDIPSWIKNNAEWWADGVISDENFVNGIQFLIKEGILKDSPSSAHS